MKALSDAALIISSHANAQSFFEYASRCVTRFKEAESIIAEGVDGIQPRSGSGGGSGAYSSPVEAKALFLMTTAQSQLERAEAQARDCREVIGAARLLCEGIRATFGIPIVADVIEERYILKKPWKELEARYGLTRQTLAKRCEIGFDWCDSNRVAWLLDMGNASKMQ